MPKSMYFQQLGGKYSFIYYDTELKKNVRLKKGQHPVIRTREEAEAFCKNWDAKHDATRKRIQDKLLWKDEYFQFADLLKLHERTRKLEAPNSYHGDHHWLNYYVFPFFLERIKDNNINNWHLYFEDFRDFLDTATPVKIKADQDHLAYATKNNIIKCLNTFLSTLYIRKKIETLHKCRYFPKHLINHKDEQSVIPREVQDQIAQALLKHDLTAHAAFITALHTGLRLNELIGLSLADLLEASPNEAIDKLLKPYELKPLAYLSIDSQPKDHLHPRAPSGAVPRKPLKGKKRITAEDARTIPIFDRKTFEILGDLWNQQLKLFHVKHYGDNPKDYLLFDGITKNSLAHALRHAQAELHFTHSFTPHDCRHTYSTWLAEQTGGNYALCKLVLGHSNLETTLRYVHMNARIQQTLRLQAQLKRPINTGSTNQEFNSLQNKVVNLSDYGILGPKQAQE